MTVDEQLKFWLSGKSIHNQDRDECCPDFSCCRPELQAPKEVREIFYMAYLKDNQDLINRLLMEFLGHLVAGKNVHIVGLEAMRQEVMDFGSNPKGGVG